MHCTVFDGKSVRFAFDLCGKAFEVGASEQALFSALVGPIKEISDKIVKIYGFLVGARTDFALVVDPVRHRIPRIGDTAPRFSL